MYNPISPGPWPLATLGGGRRPCVWPMQRCCVALRFYLSHLSLHEWESKRSENNAEHTLVLPAQDVKVRQIILKISRRVNLSCKGHNGPHTVNNSTSLGKSQQPLSSGLRVILVERFPLRDSTVLLISCQSYTS